MESEERSDVDRKARLMRLEALMGLGKIVYLGLVQR